MSVISCASLTSALKSNQSNVRVLDLSSNKLKNSGVKLLSDLLKNPHCRLETLKLVVGLIQSMLLKQYCTQHRQANTIAMLGFPSHFYLQADYANQTDI